MELHRDVLDWFAANARDLPWRRGTSPWGVLVCEVMGQQTPLSRVIPRWHAWMDRWPTPCDLAAAPQSEVLRAWDRMGYPRRALALHRCAAELCAHHGGELPEEEAALRELPGIGPYTASAVAAFAFGTRTAVLDTNVRRVLARLHGDALPPRSVTVAERARATALLPEDGTAARWSEALMELGALVCTPEPRCERCPVSDRCAWLAAGRPAAAHARRPAQPWTGTDRQSRGRILAALRATDVTWVSGSVLLGHARVSDDDAQPARALASLVRDGLVTRQGEEYALGSDILER